MLVYGRNVAKEILKKNKKVEKLILQEGFEDNLLNSLIEKNKLKPIYAPKCKIDDLVDGVHQGIILSIPDYEYFKLDEILNEEVVVILDHLEDPHNVGAIIRTCEAAGIKSVVIPKDRQALINATVMKTSVGTVEDVKVAMVTNLVNAINKLKENGFWIVGTTLSDRSVDYREIDYGGKVALVIGNEGNGISNIVEKNCDYLAKIPMYGTTNSLNASVAAGIMIYEVVRNRK